MVQTTFRNHGQYADTQRAGGRDLAWLTRSPFALVSHWGVAKWVTPWQGSTVLISPLSKSQKLESKSAPNSAMRKLIICLVFVMLPPPRHSQELLEHPLNKSFEREELGCTWTTATSHGIGATSRRQNEVFSLLFLQLAAAATPPLGIPADWVDAWSRGTLFYSPTTPRDKWDLHGEGVLLSQKIDAFSLAPVDACTGIFNFDLF